jgi:hypothetical protein
VAVSAFRVVAYRSRLLVLLVRPPFRFFISSSRPAGLVNTMVFTHLPSNACLMLVPFALTLGIAIALLLIRSSLSQMDVPARNSYVMAIVTPPERPAAASVTNTLFYRVVRNPAIPPAPSR